MSTETDETDDPTFDELLAPLRKRREEVSQHCISVRDSYIRPVEEVTNKTRCLWCKNRVASTCHNDGGNLSLTRAELVSETPPERCPGYKGPVNMDAEPRDLEGWAAWSIAFDIRQGMRDPTATE